MIGKVKTECVVCFPSLEVLGSNPVHLWSSFPDVFVTTDVHNEACLPPPTKRSIIDGDHITIDHHNGQIVIQTSQASDSSHLVIQTTQPNGVVVPFSPMEQIEELDVVASYCYDDDAASPEKALGIDLQNGQGSSSQRQLMGK